MPIEGGMSEVVGSFQPESVHLVWCDAHPERSTLTVELRTDTVSTGIAGRDIELRGEAFFDAGKFPHASFSSTKIAARQRDFCAPGNVDDPWCRQIN